MCTCRTTKIEGLRLKRRIDTKCRRNKDLVTIRGENGDGSRLEESSDHNDVPFWQVGWWDEGRGTKG
jgi:hypothetical protein